MRWVDWSGVERETKKTNGFNWAALPARWILSTFLDFWTKPADILVMGFPAVSSGGGYSGGGHDLNALVAMFPQDQQAGFIGDNARTLFGLPAGRP